MAHDQRKRRRTGKSTPKPGSDPRAAARIGGKGDFGVPESDVPERTYTSENTKASDPGASHPRAGSDEGRVSGVGGTAVGRGASSGGDVDVDLIGVGTGGSTVSAGGSIHEKPGPDDVDADGRDFASGPPAQGKNQTHIGQVGGDKRVDGSTVDQSGGDRDTSGFNQGADAITNPPARNDNAFAGEISLDEAAGQEGV